jgi:hypothetical protein
MEGYLFLIILFAGIYYYYNKVREGLIPIFNKVKFFFMLILFILFLRSLFP